MTGSSVLGECCVCGKETTLKCSACAEHDFALFVCSREHQKLIWSAHKHVCGEKSKPFLWPPLFREELNELLKELHVPFQYADKYAPLTTQLQRWYKLTTHDLASIFLALSELITTPEANKYLRDPFSQSLLRTIRALETVRIHKLGPPDTVPAIFRQAAFYSISVLDKMQEEPDQLKVNWVSDFHHRLLIAAAVDAQIVPLHFGAEIQKFAEIADKAVKKWVDEVLVKEHPVEAAQLSKIMQ